MQENSGFEDIFFTARDGLRLYARRYPAPGSRLRPALCLAGLTRNSRDFHDLALYLCRDATSPRTVYTLDYRGRGRSEYDTDWRKYSVPAELLDVVDFMTVVALHDAAIIGTSRGGLIAMVMAAVQPSTTGAVVLNDIGPVIETEGLARIAGYVGRIPLPSSWPAAAALVRDLGRRQFPSVSDDVWQEVAYQWFNDKNGRPAAAYDPKLSRALSVLDGPIPALWPQFESLKRVPVMVLRGEMSDILSETTVEDMRRRHPRLTSLTVPGQGHAPLLKEQPVMAAISQFLANADPTGLRHALAA